MTINVINRIEDSFIKKSNIQIGKKNRNNLIQNGKEYDRQFIG